METVMRKKRIQQGWLQEDVAQQIGVTRPAYQLIETAKRKPSYGVLIQLENLFGLTHRELFAPATEEPHRNC